MVMPHASAPTDSLTHACIHTCLHARRYTVCVVHRKQSVVQFIHSITHLWCDIQQGLRNEATLVRFHNTVERDDCAHVIHLAAKEKMRSEMYRPNLFTRRQRSSRAC